MLITNTFIDVLDPDRVVLDAFDGISFKIHLVIGDPLTFNADDLRAVSQGVEQEILRKYNVTTATQNCSELVLCPEEYEIDISQAQPSRQLPDQDDIAKEILTEAGMTEFSRLWADLSQRGRNRLEARQCPR